MQSEDADRDLAALLMLSVESGALTLSEVIARVDVEIGQRADAPTWMLDASLAENPEDLARILDRASFAHPVLLDHATILEVLALAFGTGRITPEAFAKQVCGLALDDLPQATTGALADLEEEAFCAHEHNGVPQAGHVLKAAQRVAVASLGASQYSKQIESLRHHAAPPQSAG